MKYFFATLTLFLLSITAYAQQAPGVFATTIDGKQITTAELNGKVVVLNMWYINCPNCVEEIKMLNEVADQYKDNKDVLFLGLTTNSPKELGPFLKKNPFKYQVVPSAMNLIFGKFGTFDKNGQVDFPFPQHFVVGRDGTILMKMIGIKGVAGVKAELQKQFPSSGKMAVPAKKT